MDCDLQKDQMFKKKYDNISDPEKSFVKICCTTKPVHLSK